MIQNLTKRTLSANYRLGISNDLVVSASMGWSSKQPKTNLDHFQTLKSKSTMPWLWLVQISIYILMPEILMSPF